MIYPLLNDILRSPEEVGTGGGTPELSADDILSKLNEGGNDEDKDKNSLDTKEELEEKIEDKEEIEIDEDENKEKDELAEIEEDLKEPTEEDLELKTPVQRRALLKDFPDIFKKHPGLESTIYRERAYTELLPTIADAKDALSALTTLDRFEADLKQGKTTDIMKAVLQDDPKGFAKLADNYMENLAAVDERAYHHVLGNVTKDIVEAMVSFGREKNQGKKEGERGAGDDILDAASSLYQFMFNDTKWKPKQRLAMDEVHDSTVSAEKAKLDKEKQEWEKSKQNEHTTKLMTSIDNQVKGTIEKSIDSKDQMTPFVKAKAIEEVQKKAGEFLKKDTRFQQIINQLNERARKEKFSDESLNRIKSTYFNRYKAILLPIIKSVRSEALKGTNARIKSHDSEKNDTTERANRGKESARNSKDLTNLPKNKPLPGESSMDFLLRRAN